MTDDVPTESGAAAPRATVATRAEAAAALFGPQGALIGLDLGTKTIGVAVSDGLRLTATPLEILERGKMTADAAHLAALAADRQAAGVVLGLPVDMTGDERGRAQATRAYARNLADRLGLSVWLWDERLSTVAVERTLLEADASRRRRGQVVDKLAAAYILQGALDRLQALAAAPGDHDE